MTKITDFSDYAAEDFLANESFQRYCERTDEGDIRFWEHFIQNHPEKEKEILEAKELFSVLTAGRSAETELTGFKSLLEQHNPRQLSETYVDQEGKISWFKYAAYALPILIVGVIMVFYFKPAAFFSGSRNQQGSIKNGGKIYAKRAEKKKVTLEDGTVVLLNADSKFWLNEDFGVKSREVHIEGEAFFDVTHDAKKPFIVHTRNFDVSVLGTAFNVRAYSGDRVSQAALIRGKIAFLPKGGNQKPIIIYPNQKITLYETRSEDKPAQNQIQLKPVLEPISTNKMNDVVETSWTKNNLELDNETLSDAKLKIERWYDVQLIIEEPELLTNRYKATFKNESINEVLEALKKIDYFKYEINKDKKIIISKK